MSTHRLTFRHALLLACAGGSVPPLHAQASRLTLAEVRAEADRASPRLRAADAAARAAGLRVRPSTRPPDPVVQLGWMSYSLPEVRPMAPLAMRQLQVMQMLPVAGRLGAQRAVAEAGSDASVAQRGAVRLAVRREVTESFLELSYLDQAIALARETERLANDLRETSAAMFRGGEGQSADVLRADVEVARMRAEIERMTAMRRATEAGLVALLARRAASAIGEVAPAVLPATLPALDSLVAIARVRRPEIAASDAVVRGTAASERVARSELWPDVTVGLQLADGRDLAGMRETMGSLMLGASLPVFASRRQLAMREEAAAMRQMAEADRAMLASETEGEVAMAHADLTRARRLRELYARDVLPAADAALTASLAAYRAGTVPFMTVLDAQMTLTGHREALLALDRDEGRAWALLESLTDVDWFTIGAAAPGGRDD